MKILSLILVVVLMVGCSNAPNSIIGTYRAPIGPTPTPRLYYRVYRGTTPTNMEPLFNVTDENFVDDTAFPGVRYCYKVTAVYADGSESGPTKTECLAI